jgi:hypothetical protein
MLTLVKQHHLLAAAVCIEVGAVKFFDSIFDLHANRHFQICSDEFGCWHVTPSIAGFLDCFVLYYEQHAMLWKLSLLPKLCVSAKRNKAVPVQTMKVYGGIIGVAPFIFNLGVTWMRVVNLVPWLLF